MRPFFLRDVQSRDGGDGDLFMVLMQEKCACRFTIHYTGLVLAVVRKYRKMIGI